MIMTTSEYKSLSDEQKKQIKLLAYATARAGSNEITCINDVIFRFDTIDSELERLELDLQAKLKELEDAKTIYKNLKTTI